MTRNLRYLFLLLFIGLTGASYGQAAPGEIDGKVIDEKGQTVIGAVVTVSTGGITKTGAQTDFDGNYIIKPLEPGRYDVTVKGLNYKETTITDVIVSADKTTALNFTLQTNTTTLTEHVVTAYKVPLVDKYNPGGQQIITSDQIEKLPTRQTNDVIATAPGVYQSKSGGSISIEGGRSDGNNYIVDGVLTLAGRGVNLPQNSVDQIEVNTSGLSAKYGDVMGGVPVITTKGAAPILTGDVLLQTSVDGYNNNLVSFFISGPLYRKKLSDGSKKNIIGFNLGADFYDNRDPNPSYIGYYTVKPGELQNLQNNPLHLTSDASGNQVFRYSSEYVLDSDLVHKKTYPNTQVLEGRLTGKLDFELGNNLNLVAGGNFNYTKTQDGGYTLDLFDQNATPVTKNYTGRGYVRFSQKFGKSTGAGEAPKSGNISNVYYQLQGDYQLDYTGTYDPRFNHNIFDYGYVGKFNEQYSSFYNPFTGVDSVTGIRGVTYQGPGVTSVTFQPSNLNPILANYTQEYYNQSSLPITSTNQIRSNLGLLNGDFPNFTYGYFPNVGNGVNGYSFAQDAQYSFSADASFDLQIGKNRHSIEFGLYYQQQVERGYSVAQGVSNTYSLWELMRQLTNSHIAIDKNNPVFVVGGKRYSLAQVKSGLVNPGPADTILYNLAANTAAQSTFDKNLRTKLGLNPNGTDLINVDAYDPNEFSLSMFSPDELLNSGTSFVSYYGYTYTGGPQTGQVNFSDFFNQKSANGNYTRAIAPFSPNYTAGYILDKFQFKDINFNIGLRVDRFTDNEQVLDDPYSLYPEKTVAGVSGAQNTINGGKHPANIGGNYVVYVDDNTSSSPNIIGYRNGDNWYDPTGKLIQDPSVLKTYSGGRDPQPYLQNHNQKITDSSFDPNGSFRNYTPQVNLMPRLQFSFPISDVALLYGHYDVYVQRPTTGVITSPTQYYFMQQNAQFIINNPDLRPQRTFDYEVGFQQKLTDQSSITISLFYKERKDMIQVRPYLYAWPITYYTFGNRDFSTTKGMTLKYDLRRIGHLRMNLSYTLQFADGTGSDAVSTNNGSANQISPYGLLQNLISSGLPNLRYSTFLNIDSRHDIVANLDYRYDEGEGPVVGGNHILQNAGANLIFSTRSGEPYTRLIDPVSNQIDGSVNGSRYPWHYNVNLRIDKELSLSTGKMKKRMAETGVKPKRQLSLDVFAYAQNLLNTKDILFVYGYTGRPNDDGYLASPFGQAAIPQQTNPASYALIYQLYHNSPGNYNLPRQINLGVQFNF
ncbi:MAG TPA: carboxypeptidase regulatory-like domain-containing protein [Flavipsychrobacter sp.]|nr:carboxypeptidase regulatory-like domain-containing protein [Flavipsychrobacter sp.]